MVYASDGSGNLQGPQFMKTRSAYNFIRDLLKDADWYGTAIEMRQAFGSDLEEEARRIIDRGSGMCTRCFGDRHPNGGYHEDGKCPL